MEEVCSTGERDAYPKDTCLILSYPMMGDRSLRLQSCKGVQRV